MAIIVPVFQTFPAKSPKGLEVVPPQLHYIGMIDVYSAFPCDIEHTRQTTCSDMKHDRIGDWQM